MKLFTDHLKTLNESYIQHFGFSMKVCIWMLLGSLACLIHSFFPFIFTKTASNYIKKINELITSRVENSKNI